MSELGRRFSFAVSFAILVSCFPLSAWAQESAPRVYGLDECIAIAQKSNPDIAIAVEGYRKTESSLLMSYGGLLPSFSMGFSLGHVFYGPSSVQFDASGRPVVRDGFDYPDYNFRLSSDIQLYDGGATINRVRSAMSSRDASREDLRYRKDLIAAQVIRAYYNLVRDKMLLRVQDEGVALAKRNLERSEALLQVGSATRADVLKARVQYSNTKLSLIEATNAVELARDDLLTLLKIEPGRAMEVDTTMKIDFVEPDAEAEVQFAMTHRADLRSLEFGIKAANAGVSAAQGGWLPTLGASLSYNWNDRKMARDLNFFDSEYLWGLTGYLSFNLFDRFATSSNVGIAKANARIAEYSLDKAKLGAAQEVRNLVIIMTQARERATVATETVEQAGENLRLAEERYRVGAGTMLETIDAEVALTQAKANVIQAKCDYAIASADLSRATGRKVYE